MKRYQKLIAMALAAVLCLGIFAGCSSSAVPPEGMNGTLLEVTNEVRKSAGLKALTYDAGLSQKAEEIIKMFQDNEKNAYWDDDLGLVLDGECFYGIFDYENERSYGAWDDIDDEGHAVQACLWAQYDSSLYLSMIKGNLAWDIYNEGKYELMDEAAAKVGFATGKVKVTVEGETEERDFWAAVVRKADGTEWTNWDAAE